MGDLPDGRLAADRPVTMSSPLPALAEVEPASAGLDPAIVVGLAVLAALAVVLVLCFWIHARLQRERDGLQALGSLPAIEAAVHRLADEQGGLDLRRLEHVLIDIRDGQRRVEERLMRLVESLQAREESPAPAPAAPPAAASGRLAERVTGRLIAMGFERIEILTPFDELEGLAEGDGEVLVEARRGGSPHKGRVLVRDGSIAEVRMRDGYEAFP